MGYMQDVRVYNAALSSNDVQLLYQNLAVKGSPSSFAASGGAAFAAPGEVQLTFSGAANTSYRIWSTTNLALAPVTSTWTLVSSGAFPGSGSVTVTDTQATTQSKYYVITQP